MCQVGSAQLMCQSQPASCTLVRDQAVSLTHPRSTGSAHLVLCSYFSRCVELGQAKARLEPCLLLLLLASAQRPSRGTLHPSRHLMNPKTAHWPPLVEVQLRAKPMDPQGQHHQGPARQSQATLPTRRHPLQAVRARQTLPPTPVQPQLCLLHLILCGSDVQRLPPILTASDKTRQAVCWCTHVRV